MITDENIIELFFARSEQGIRELDTKYGKDFHNLSYHIVGSRQDAEECVNDAYLCCCHTRSGTADVPAARTAPGSTPHPGICATASTYHGTEGSRSLWVPVQSFSSFDLLIAAHPCRVQSEFKVIDFMSVTAGDHQLKPPAQRRHPFYRNLAVVG